MPQIARPAIRFWLRILGANLAAAMMVVVAFSGITVRTPLRDVFVAFGVGFVFASAIGPMLGFAMPRLAPWIWRRLRFPFNWAAIVTVMIGIAIVGSLIALSLLTIIGYLPPARFFGWFLGSIKIAIVVTLTFGLTVTMYEVMQARLQQTTLALRTKERDEADARRLAAEAQLASIESRVQPHFLFNTLNSIAALVHDDPAGAERMTGQLASLLRSSLDSQSTPLTTLNQEIEVVRDYLEIERVRFGERLRYRVDVVSDAGEVLVPRLSLQTLAENSVKFAVSPRREGATIVVSASPLDGRLRVTVEDDGPGFDGGATPDGHGLALLKARLAMIFGERATIHVDGTPGRARVSFEVPVHLGSDAG
jgi:LytS/YehU family sensor histidine kinase